MFKLARVIGKLVPATLALKSKSERGYDLTANKPAEAARDTKIKLQRGLSTEDAFRVIGRSVLRHISAHEPAVRASDAEGVHQMRVGLRRLRAAISLFSKLLDDSHTQRIKAKLRWLTGELAPARDLDVYMKSKVEPLSGAVPAKPGVQELASELVSRRDAALKKAKDAVELPALPVASPRHAGLA